MERNGLPKIPRWVLVQYEIQAEQKVPKPQPDAYKNAPLTIVGDHTPETIDQMRNCMAYSNVVAGAICADSHFGYAQPVGGGVIAYEKQISISGVGFDIACGNMATRLDTTYGDVKERLPDILERIQRTISFGIGRHNQERVDAALFDDEESWRASDMIRIKDRARDQLGTVGSGNHYDVDVFAEAHDTTQGAF
ncbi:RtcB family protein [Saccharibacter sp. 17.LH.SD]|uniref:RtcB family protein n=1 Tax=Saccharibacter sp. 17.LH.SD TaxID=2689393 RepID=UPI00351BC836